MSFNAMLLSPCPAHEACDESFHGGWNSKSMLFVSPIILVNDHQNLEKFGLASWSKNLKIEWENWARKKAEKKPPKVENKVRKRGGKAENKLIFKCPDYPMLLSPCPAHEACDESFHGRWMLTTERDWERERQVVAVKDFAKRSLHCWCYWP